MSAPDPPQRVSLDGLSLTALRLGVIGLVGYGALLVWARLSFILLPFAVAVLLAALLTPLAARLHHTLRFPRALAAIVTVILTVGLIAGLLTWITPDIVRQAEDLGTQIQDGVDQLPDTLHGLGLKDSDIERFTKSLTEKVQDSGGAVGNGVISAAQSVANVGASIFLALMMLIYLLFDGAGFWRGVLRFAPADRRRDWHAAGVRSWAAITSFVRSQVLVAAIDGIGIGVGLTIIGVPLAIPLAVLTFILAFIPYIGAILAGAAATLVALSTNGVEGAIGAIVITLLVQQIEGNILYPLLIGHSVKLHPLTVLLGVGAGSALLGITGAFLATPVIAAVAAAAGWLEDDEDVGSPAPEVVVPLEGDPPPPEPPEPEPETTASR